MRRLNLDGDRQADLTVHGGEHKAVYLYPIEHYAYWKKKLPGRELPPGSFGENFTTEGLLEDEIHIGDQFAIGLPRAPRSDAKGTAEVIVTQPRLPCYKLGIRFEADDMSKKIPSQPPHLLLRSHNPGRPSGSRRRDQTPIPRSKFHLHRRLPRTVRNQGLDRRRQNPSPPPLRSPLPYPTTGNPISTTASKRQTPEPSPRRGNQRLALHWRSVGLKRLASSWMRSTRAPCRRDGVALL